MSFKIKLLTPRVTATESQTVGDSIDVENDEAYLMIKNEVGELVGKKAPVKPQSIIDAEEAEAAELKAAEEGTAESEEGAE